MPAADPPSIPAADLPIDPPSIPAADLPIDPPSIPAADLPIDPPSIAPPSIAIVDPPNIAAAPASHDTAALLAPTGSEPSPSTNQAEKGRSLPSPFLLLKIIDKEGEEEHERKEFKELLNKGGLEDLACIKIEGAAEQQNDQEVGERVAPEQTMEDLSAASTEGLDEDEGRSGSLKQKKRGAQNLEDNDAQESSTTRKSQRRRVAPKRDTSKPPSTIAPGKKRTKNL